ncbi:OLC1v1021599C1 [Oldenlandia corymbosa var. corymbosa]|uniref:OLC1v1021599C1 n=1 Tax=Oldenlandia corymbosa var. corymbosa TaxID=529605 RepID=A0AAV1BXJ5_OLDCO|nr:OLC1v1021599C1 [Oldenlandia corymbosa var. corymbosa]
MASKLLLAVVFVVDLIAFALAVAAEQRRATARHKKDDTTNYCVYKSDVSTGLGVGSLLLLLSSQLLIMIASRCMCCGRALRPGRARTWSIILFISCWYVLLSFSPCNFYVSLILHYHMHCLRQCSRKGCNVIQA